MRNEIVIIGGGGHARVVIDLIKLTGKYEIIGILDNNVEIGTKISGISVIGNDGLLAELREKNVNNICIGVGTVKDTFKRESLYKTVKQFGFCCPPMIHPKAITSSESNLEDGAQVMAGAIVQTDSVIGKNTVINTGAIIDHDCSIGSHAFISSRAVVSGGCTIDDGAFIGAGSTIIQGIRIGQKAVIGAGAVVINDVPEKSKVVGVPAK